jgi:hypothetical protein
MSKISLEGNVSGSGTFTIASPNTNTSYTLTLPQGTGTFVASGVNSSIVSGTSQASTSGTSIDFTGIPSWVKKITVMFSGVSTSGTSNILVRIGSGSIVTSGYLSGMIIASSTVSSSNVTGGFPISTSVGATNVYNGFATLCLLNASTNTWVYQSSTCRSDAAVNQIGAGSLALSGALDQIRITTVNGTDTFDAGSINILYE